MYTISERYTNFFHLVKREILLAQDVTEFHEGCLRGHISTWDQACIYQRLQIQKSIRATLLLSHW